MCESVLPVGSANQGGRDISSSLGLTLAGPFSLSCYCLHPTFHRLSPVQFFTCLPAPVNHPPCRQGELSKCNSRIPHLLRFLSGSPLTVGDTPKCLVYQVLLHFGPQLMLPASSSTLHCSSFLERLNLPPSTHTLLPSFAFLSSLSIKGPHFIPNPRTPWGLCLCDTHLQQDLRLKIIHLAVPSLTSAGGKVAQRGRLVHCGFPITHLCLSGNMALINSLPQ